MPHQLPPAASVEKALTVSQLNAQIESQLKILGRLWVEGEVSSIKYHRSKHWYFDIKDRDSCVSCVMFSKNNRTMTWQPKVGDKVRLSGTLSVYSPRGTYSFVTYRIEKAGLGEYLIRLAELRKKLQLEGLFDHSRKRRLPFLPRRIGIATSAVGAALTDILKVINQRFPNVDIYIVNCLVQGPAAPKSIMEAIKILNQHGKSDVLIIGRGGGSTEDLAAFNDEGVVRAIAASKIPTICAVGHEVDNSLSDLVADERAATPSHAASLAVPVYADLHNKVAEQKSLVFRHMIQVLRTKYDALQRNKPIEPLHRIEELRQSLLYFEKMLTQQMQHLLRLRVETLKQLQPVDPLHAIEKSEQYCAQLGKQVLRLTEQLLRLKNEKLRSLKPSAPMQRFELYEKRLQQLFVQLEPLVHIQLQRQEELLKKEAAALNALSPLAILSRGYAIAFRDGKAVLDASSLKQGDRLDLRLHKGVAQVRVDNGTKRRSTKRKDVQAEEEGSKNPIQPGLFD